jgi:hypothetical protein
VKHVIVRNNNKPPAPPEPTLEWKIDYDHDGEVSLYARKPGDPDWTQILYVDKDGDYVERRFHVPSRLGLTLNVEGQVRDYNEDG